MYDVDDKDRLVSLSDVPQSSLGAPIPVIVADEHTVVLAYYLEERPPHWDGSTIRMVSPDTDGEPVAIVRFASSYAHMSGPPNDEAFRGHPLAERGLRPYQAFEVLHSSWIRKLERMNSVHPRHKPERFWELHHYVFAFHDSTFECACHGFSLTMIRGSLEAAILQMVKLLGWHRS